MAKQLNVNLAFTADTGQARAQLQDLQNRLTQLSTMGAGNNSFGLTKELSEATTKATELKAILQTSTNANGMLDLKKFSDGLKQNGTTLKDYAKSLSSLGPEGQKAFTQLAQSVSLANVQFQRSNGLLSEMWTTMKNTARWQITSSALHSFIGGLQSAIGYAKDLNRTLTDIRIVAPEKSMEDMAKFADLANKRAKELSSTTLDYAKGALIYYQQGLDDIQVQERTDVTTKMANVTGDSADEVSSYMTAIWNNFNRAGDESAEHFADILTKLGAETAASTTEITTALEKYSAVADTIGLSYEAATAAATTLIDRTRETPEVAGTALKTIFARIEGLKQEGSTDEGGTTTSLNKYSEALHNIGVEIKNANGQMRDADDIINDIGEKWSGLAEDQKIALAETVAGVRQWNQFAALMNNFDYYKQYKELAAIGSDGSLQEQQEIYAESWQAASNRVKASIQTIYMQILDDKFFISLTNKIADLVDGFGKLVDGIGGLKTILPLVGTLMFKAFGQNMADSLHNTVSNIQMMSQSSKDAIIAQKREANKALVETNFSNDYQGTATATAYQAQYDLQDRIIEKGEIKNEQEQRYAQLLQDQNRALNEQLINQGQITQEAENQAKKAELKAEGTIYGLFDSADADDIYDSVKEAGLRKQEASYLSGFNSDLSTSLNQIKQIKTEVDQVDKRVEQEKKLIQEKIKVALQTGTEQGILSEQSEQQLKNLATELEKDDVVIEQIQEKINNITRESQVLATNAETNARELFMAGGDYSTEDYKDIQDAINNRSQVGESADELNKSIVRVKENSREAQQQIESFNKQLPTGSQVMIQFTSALMGGVMAYQALTNAVEVFKDSDASFSEQMMAGITALTMTIPALTSALQLLKVENAQALLASLATATGIEIEGTAAITASQGVKILGLSLKSLFLNPYTWLFLGLAAAIGAVAIALKKNYEATHKARNAFKEIKEENETLREGLNKTKESAEGLTDSLDKIKSAAETLKDTELGSSKWTETLSEANNEVNKLKDNYRDLTDQIKKRKGGKDQALDQINEQLREEGLDETKTLSLQEGIDYYIDATGLKQFTKSGEIKLDTVKTITIHNADVALNANQITEDRAELAASIERLQHSTTRGVTDSGYIKGPTNATDLAHGSYQIYNGSIARVQTEVIDRDFDIEKIAHQLAGAYDFEESKLLDENWLKAAGINDDEFIEELKNSEEFQSGIYEVVQQMKGLQEKQIESYQNQLLENKKVQEGIFDLQKSGLTQKQIDKYGGGLVSTMAGDMQNRIDTRKGMYEKDLIKGQYVNATQAREAFAEQNGMKYTSENGGQFIQYDSKGEETGRKKHSEFTEQYKEWLATSEAEQKATENLEIYKNKIADTERDNKSLEKISKSWNNQRDALSAASKELQKIDKTGKKSWKDLVDGGNKAAKAVDEYADTIRDDLKEALDITNDNFDDSILDGEFITRNGALIEKAINGDIEAIQELQRQVALTNLHKNGNSLFEGVDKEFKNLQEDFNSFLNEINLDDISVGVDVDTSQLNDSEQQVLNMMHNLLASGVATSDTLSGMFGDMFNIEFDGYDLIPINSSTWKSSADEMNHYASIGMPVTDITEDGLGYHIDQETIDENARVASAGFWKSQGYYMIPHVKGFKKNANIPKAPSSSASNSGSTGNASGDKGGSGRRAAARRRQERVRRAKRQNEKSIVVERYKEINDKLERNERETDRLSKLQDKLYGKARLNQMDQVNKKHLEEINLIRKKQKEARQYYLNDKRDAQEALKDVMKISKEVQKGVKKINKYDRLTSEQKAALARIDELNFNNFGEITNYTSIMKALQDQLNAYERVYNSKKNFGNEESQSKYKEKIIDPLKEKIDALQEAIDQYDETRELVEELKDQIDDAYNEWQTANYERLQYALEINVSINDNQLKRLDYYFNKVSNNVYKAAEAFDMYFTGVGSYSSTMKDKVSVVADNLQQTLEQVSQTREDLLAETAKAKAALEDAKKNYSTSKKVTGKKNKKGRYISYDINSFGNWKNAKKQYDRAKKLLKIGRIKKDKFDKIKSRFEQQDKYKKLYDAALKRYRDALRAGGVSVQEAQANLDKITLTEEEKKKIKEIRKDYSNKQQTNKYKKAKKAYKKAIKDWKKVGKKKTSGQYYEAAKKAWKALEKAKANYNKKYNENKYLKAKKAWEKSGKKKSGKAYEKYQEQLKARKAYKDALKQYSGKYSEANYNSAKSKYEKAKAKLKSMKKGTQKYKKQKEKVKALKEAFNQQKLLKEQYELWSIALENAKSNEELISNQNAALEAQKQELAGVNEQLSEYTQLTAVGGKIGAITKAIFLQVEAYTELEKEYQNCEISQAQYVEGMQQSYDTTLDLLSQLQDLKNEMKDYYGDVISNASEELSKFNTQLDHQASVISHLQTLADLANKQKDFDLYENFSLANMAINQAQAAEDRAQYATFSRELELAKDKRDQVKEQIESLNKNSKDFTSEYSNTVKQEIADAEKRLEQIKKSGSKEEIANAQEILNSLKEGQKAVEQLNSDKLGEVLKTQLDYYEKMVESADEAASNAYDSMFGNLEEAMENNASLLETSLQRAADAMEKALTQIAGGFEEISRQMGLTSTNQDEYLTKTNQNYELNKLQRTLQKDIDKTNNREAKTRFANFSKELKQLQEKDKLSNLELEIAQKRYELLKAQIDLEDSRNAKQTIRLSRDSEGNYGYVYVANEDQVEDAKQAVEDANNDLYNLQLQATNNYGQKYIQTAQEMQQALMEAQEITDKTEREARINAIRDQYGTLMDTYKNLYEIGYGATDYLEDALKADSWVYDNYNGIVNNVSNNLSAFNNYIEDANRAWSEWQANTDKIYQLYDIQGLFNKILPDTQEKVNKNLDDFQTALSAINDVLAKVHEKLFNFVEAVLPVLEKWIQSTEGTADKMLDNIIYQSTHDTSKDRYENFNKMMQILADKEGLAKGAGYNYYEGALYSTGGQLGSNAKMAQTWDMSFNEAQAKDFLNKGGQYTDGYYGFTSDGKLMFTLNPTEEQLKEFKSLVTKAIKLDSGGYTGDWTDENSGKLAFLHEKELVLNANDTQNILAVVDSVREMAAAGFLSSLHSASINSSALGASSIAQEVHIDAQFPGVTDRYEIEQAFNNLANRAVQYANNTRK